MIFPQRRIGHHVFVQVGEDESRRALSAEQIVPYALFRSSLMRRNVFESRLSD